MYGAGHRSGVSTVRGGVKKVLEHRCRWDDMIRESATNDKNLQKLMKAAGEGCSRHSAGRHYPLAFS
eukprot:8464275-Heterocapsa_arctica.AAC.1